MDARKLRLVIFLIAFGTIGSSLLEGATYKTPNFTVHAPTREFAERVGEAAEYYREKLAVAWLGKRLKKWYHPCPIEVRVGQIGAGGATSFQFNRGEVFGWRMNIQGSEERILDSVLPHEISHTIFASHFRRPLPRWADEGAATLIEHESERMRQMQLLQQVSSNGTRYRLRQLMSISEYPEDMQQILKLYAQGYSLSDYLIQKKGKQTFLTFLDTAHNDGWDVALNKHYGYKNIETLEGKWNNWYMAGSPRLNLPEGDAVASAESSEPAVVRGQTPEQKNALSKETANIELGDSKSALETVEQTQPAVKVAVSDTDAPLFAASSSAESKPQATPAVDVISQGRQRTLTEGWEPVALSKPAKPQQIARTRQRNEPTRERPPFSQPQNNTAVRRNSFAATGLGERPPFEDDGG